MLGFTHSSLTNFLFWVTNKKWFLITLLIGLLLCLLPTPDGLTDSGYHTLVITITALMLIITEPIPLPAIALYILIMEVYLGIGTADSIAKSFMNDAVFFIMGSLMLAVAIIKQGWDARIALGIINITGHKTRNIVLGFTAISALLSSIMGQHTVAAIMLPIAMTLIRYTSSESQDVRNLSAVLLFAIAYGALIGSNGTPSGGGRNVIMMGYLKDSGIIVTYLGWVIRVFPMVLIQIPIVSWILMKSFVPEYIHLDSGVRKLVVHVANSKALTGRSTVAMTIFILTMFGWIFFSEKIGLGTIALTGVFLYLVTGNVRWADLNQNTHWGVIILFGSTISLGTHIKDTGLGEWLAFSVSGWIGNVLDHFPFMRDLFVAILTTFMANVLSGSATVAVLGPITLHMGNDVLHMGYVTAIASAFGFFTVAAAPACTIIYSSGMIRAKDFLKVGWKVGLISILIMVIYANTYWLIFN